MEALVLILGFGCTVVFGFRLMKKIDRFLDEAESAEAEHASSPADGLEPKLLSGSGACPVCPPFPRALHKNK